MTATERVWYNEPSIRVRYYQTVDFTASRRLAQLSAAFLESFTIEVDSRGETKSAQRGLNYIGIATLIRSIHIASFALSSSIAANEFAPKRPRNSSTIDQCDRN